MKFWETVTLSEDFISTPFSNGQHFAPNTFVGSGRLKRILSSIKREYNPHASDLQVSAIETGSKRTSSLWKLQKSPTILEIDLSPCLQFVLDCAATGTNTCCTVTPGNTDSLADSLETLVIDLTEYDAAYNATFLTSALGSVADLLDIVRSTTKSPEKQQKYVEQLHLSHENFCTTIKLTTALTLLIAKLWHLCTIQGNMALTDQAWTLLLKSLDLSFLLTFHVESLAKIWRRTQETTHLPYGVTHFSASDNEIGSIVTLHNLLGQLSDMGKHLSIWDYLVFENELDDFTSDTVTHLDQRWRDIATILPFLDIDESGVKHSMLLRGDEQSLWILARKLMSHCIPDAFAGSAGSIFYQRWLWLSSTWGWPASPDFVQFLIDALLQRPGGHWTRSVSYKTPECLHYLATFVDSNSVSDSTSCSEISLKLASMSIRKRVDLDAGDLRKLKSFVTSILPTKAHSFASERDEREIGPIALKQRVDLMCVIYASTTPQCRPTIRRIRHLFEQRPDVGSLGDLELSTLKQIVRYHMSRRATELMDCTVLAECCQWLGNLIRCEFQAYQTPSQISSNLLKLSSASTLTPSTASHQQLTFATALPGPAHPGKSYAEEMRGHHMDFLCSCFDFASEVITSCMTAEETLSFVPWDALIQAMGVSLEDKCLYEVFSSAASFISRLAGQSENRSNSVITESECDSQDFGSFDYEHLERKRIVEQMHHRLHLSIKRVLSNVLSEETTHGLLYTRERLLGLWADIALGTVSQGLADWDNYIGPHGSDSWAFFAGSQSTRDGFILFLAKVMATDSGVFLTHEATVLKAFFEGLVDNRISHEYLRLLFNEVVKTKPSGDDLFVSLGDWQSRDRILATCFNNMRSIWLIAGGSDLVGRRCSYLRDLVLHVIRSMVKCSHEMQSPNQDQIDHLVKVQRLLQIFLPEFNSELSRLTKNIAFLPRDLNILTNLRSYAVRGLDDPNTAKRLLAFLQTTFENALATSNAISVSNHLIAAMGLDIDRSSDEPQYDSISLRFFLLENVFPAYLDAAASCRAAARLAEPVVLSLQEAYKVLRLYSSRWGTNVALRLLEATERLLAVEEAAPGTLPAELVAYANETLDFIERSDPGPEEEVPRARRQFLRYAAEDVRAWVAGVEERDGSFFRRGRWIGSVVPK